MTHATAEQVHDHAFGFRRSSHVETCADCGRAAAVVAEELDALGDVLDAPPKARARIGPAGLTAAAFLLAALSWLLFQPADRNVPAAPLPTQESDIDRIIGELRSGSPLRQEIARLALRKYMGTGVGPLTRAGVDPSFIDEVRLVSANDRALMKKLKSTPLTMEHDRILYNEVLHELEATTGRIEVDFTGIEFDTAFVKISVRNGTVYDAIEQLCASLRVPFKVMHGRLTIGKVFVLPSLAPVRIRPRDANPARHVADLSSDVPEKREAAFAALRRLGFAAEPALWDALSAESLETRSHASRLLKGLYDPPHPSTIPLARTPFPAVTFVQQNRPFAALVTDLLSQVGGDHSLVWDSRVALPESFVSIQVRDIPLDGAMNLLVGPHGFRCFSVENCLSVQPHGTQPAWTPPLHVLWTHAAQARALESLIEGFSSADPARREAATRGLRELPAPEALEGLASAAGYLDGDALVRCQRLRREIAETGKSWIQDLPSGAELQTLTPVQNALLQTIVAPSEEAIPLEEILRKAGIRCVTRRPIEGAWRRQGKGPNLASLLKVVLRPQGLDFYLEGETVVIDEASNVRAAVEK